MTEAVQMDEFALPAGVCRLVAPEGGDTIGYRVDGAESGPTLLASGYRATITPVFQRLARLPSLPRLRGHLLLAYVDDIHIPACETKLDRLFDEAIDRSVFLAFERWPETEPAIVARFERESYWTILKVCANLGMISGRGIPVGQTAPEISRH